MYRVLRMFYTLIMTVFFARNSATWRFFLQAIPHHDRFFYKVFCILFRILFRILFTTLFRILSIALFYLPVRPLMLSHVGRVITKLCRRSMCGQGPSAAVGLRAVRGAWGEARRVRRNRNGTPPPPPWGPGGKGGSEYWINLGGDTYRYLTGLATYSTKLQYLVLNKAHKYKTTL